MSHPFDQRMPIFACLQTFAILFHELTATRSRRLPGGDVGTDTHDARGIG